MGIPALEVVREKLIDYNSIIGKEINYNRRGKKLLGIPYVIVKSKGTEPLKTPLLAHFIPTPRGMVILTKN